MALRAHSLYPTLAKLYVEDGEANRLKSEQTRRNRIWFLRKLQEFRPDLRANEFTTQDLVEFLTTRGLAPRSQRMYRACLKSFFSWAVFRDYLRTNPAAELNRLTNFPNTRVRHGVWLSRVEAQRLLRSCDDGSPLGTRDKVILSLMALAGLRKSEVVGVRWSDIDLQRRTLTLVGKGNKLAVVSLAPALIEALERWRHDYAVGIGGVPFDHPVVVPFPIGGGLGGSERVIRPRWSVAAKGSTVDGAVRRRATAAGFAHLAPHDLRRTFAGMLEANGAGLRDIQLAMRHENIATTDTYLSSNPQRAASAIDLMAEGF